MKSAPPKTIGGRLGMCIKDNRHEWKVCLIYSVDFSHRICVCPKSSRLDTRKAYC